MRTRLTIMAIVLATASTAVAILALLVVRLGWLGLAMGAAGTMAVLVVYRVLVQPWQHRWGATDEEVRRAMPGDDLLPVAASTTRAISVAAPTEQVWPWLVQLGYSRAGWYSYDWIDNDGHPSANRIIPELQELAVGDQIPMLPGGDRGSETLSPTATWSPATTTAAAGAWHCTRPGMAADWLAAGE